MGGIYKLSYAKHNIGISMHTVSNQPLILPSDIITMMKLKPNHCLRLNVDTSFPLVISNSEKKKYLAMGHTLPLSSISATVAWNWFQVILTIAMDLIVQNISFALRTLPKTSTSLAVSGIFKDFLISALKVRKNGLHDFSSARVDGTVGKPLLRSSDARAA